MDALSPPHRLATRSAHTPWGVFDMAARTAEAAAQRLESRRWLEQHRSHPPAS